MLKKLTSGFLFLLSLVTVSACDQFDLDELRKKAPPSTPDISLSARLTGSQLVPAGSGGLGTFAGTYNQQTNILAYTVTLNSAFGAGPPEVLHLHRGAPGTVGPIAYTLPSTTNGTITLTEADEAVLLDGNLYVDAETRFREGDPLVIVTRGAIMRQPPTPAPVPGPQVALTAQVSGSQVVPPTSSTVTGSFNLLYNKDTNVLTYYSSSVFSPSTFTPVHLHRGTPGTNGPIIVELPLLFGFLPRGEATIPEADEALLLSSGTYIDLHSAEFPNGEVRGAIVPL
ncbi:CHRD domain-containing protein [Hymenobacter sp. BT188]|uniref:CHRD domain-containing protein n=1 Tax=Hymenobacter sp. BT188 TaxID=2763504 RepID=UPI0016512872|nr:CHRD domain-containing protein [Hymenobacter sp. BT188]MBC6608212.1 CHRD domain-containing protein [Hymenobacter sp. BT188]